MVRKLWPNWPVVPTVLMYLLDMTKVNTLHKSYCVTESKK